MVLQSTGSVVLKAKDMCITFFALQWRDSSPYVRGFPGCEKEERKKGQRKERERKKGERKKGQVSFLRLRAYRFVKNTKRDLTIFSPLFVRHHSVGRY